MQTEKIKFVYGKGKRKTKEQKDYELLKDWKEKLENYQGKLEKIVVDAGYESEENYIFLAENKLTSYIKPSNYEKSKTRKYKKEQEFRKSLKYDKKQDKYISQEGKEFIRCKDRYRKKKSGYIRTTKVYRCFDCNKEG